MVGEPKPPTHRGSPVDDVVFAAGEDLKELGLGNDQYKACHALLYRLRRALLDGEVRGLSGAAMTAARQRCCHCRHFVDKGERAWGARSGDCVVDPQYLRGAFADGTCNEFEGKEAGG